MKILVADDDALIRRLLVTLLTKLGHEVETVEDGQAAAHALARPEAAELAILDWVMPGLNGVEVCKRARASQGRTRPYILLLSARSDKQDVIAGLDAGADDYLIKPFDPMALLARLRVAQRTIAYQQELQNHISEMATLLQRHNLLGEIFTKQGRVASEAAPASNASPPPAAPPAPAPAPAPTTVSAGKARPVEPIAQGPATLRPDRINAMFLRSLAEVGLPDAIAEGLTEGSTGADAAFTAWAPFVLIQDGVWIDFLLEADDSSAVATFEALLGRIPVSERELVDFLAETFNLICTSVKAQLAAQGCAVLMPVIARALRTASLAVHPPRQAQLSHHRLSLPGANLVLTAIRQPGPVIQKTLGQLHEFDIVAESVPSPTATEVFLLNQGVVLNVRYIDKLSSLASASNERFMIPVIVPSPLTQFFCLGRKGGD